MSSAPTETADVPLWLFTRGERPNNEKVADITRAFDASDSRFAVRADHLEALLQQGYQSVPRFLFSVEGVTADIVGPINSSNRLGIWLHKAVTETGGIDEEDLERLDEQRQAIGPVLRWADSPGFPAILDYLRHVADAQGRSLADFTFRGTPAPSLFERLRRADTSDDSAADGPGVGAQPDEEYSIARDVLAKLQDSANVVVEGVAGSGKSHLIHSLKAAYAHVELVVFHPSTSYEEFVSGLRPRSDGGFEGRAGVFVEMCVRAARRPDELFLLFIDEINRANTSRVFGDLMLPLEKSKRVDFGETALDEALLARRPLGDDVSVRLQTPVDVLPEVGSPAEDGDVPPSSPFGAAGWIGVERRTTPLGLGYLVVPQNLHVLGTMNSTDRSVGSLDLALRRRFAWMTMEPLSSARLLSHPAIVERMAGDQAWGTVIQWYDEVNARLLAELGPDARLGHSYFFAEPTAGGAAMQLITQLAEIVHVFHAPEAAVESFPVLSLPSDGAGWEIAYEGQGFGRRPVVRDRTPRHP